MVSGGDLTCLYFSALPFVSDLVLAPIHPFPSRVVIEPERLEKRMAVLEQEANASMVEELVTKATVEALNVGLAQEGVSPERIIAVHYLEPAYVGNGHGPRYRVLYRT
ncbi:MAG: hypothetical protein M9924_21535 [Rhizobiaceae bacterium]|nr:hypothetical protein [Rhizobiaceae bacterium]